MKKNVKILYIITFVCILILPHLFFLVCKNYIDTNNYENRQFAKAPVIGKTPYTEFSSEFEQFYNDRIPFRNQLISLINGISYFAFRDSTGEQVMIGKDGWLFIEDPMQGNAKANYLGEDLLSEEELKSLADNLIQNERVLNEKGIEFVIFVAPNKNRVYSEYMPGNMGEPAEEYQLKQITDYLKNNTNLRIVYSYDAIMDGKNALKGKQPADTKRDDSDIHVYNKVDTHWNNVGAYIGSATLLKELGIDIPNITELDIKSIPNTSSDLGGMLHLQKYFVNTEEDYDVSGYNSNDATELEFDKNDVLSYSSKASDDRTVYIYRDSFGLAMAPFVGANFQKTYFKHYNFYSYDNLESVNPDVFVLETVERSARNAFETFDVLKPGKP